MALNWTTTDRAAVHGVKVLVYGDSGAGKTRLCGTAPAPIILSAESGLLVLRKIQIPVLQIDTVKDLQDAYAFCSGSREAAQFQTVCLDSISEIAERVLGNLKRQYKDPRQAYGEVIEQVTQVVRAFRDLPGKHVYFAAKMEPVKDASGITRFAPSMPGSKLGNDLPYFFDEVFRLGVSKDQQGNEIRWLQTRLDMQSTAKDRSGSLDAYEPPDLNHVFNKILGA